MITLILLILILGVPVAIIIALHFASNAVGKKMRVALHKENEPAVYVGDEERLGINPASGLPMAGGGSRGVDMGGNMYGCD